MFPDTGKSSSRLNTQPFKGRVKTAELRTVIPQYNDL